MLGINQQSRLLWTHCIAELTTGKTHRTATKRGKDPSIEDE